MARLQATWVRPVRVIRQRGRPHHGGQRPTGACTRSLEPAIHLGDTTRFRPVRSTRFRHRRRRRKRIRPRPGPGPGPGGESRRKGSDNTWVGPTAADTESPINGWISITLRMEFDGGGDRPRSAASGVADTWRPALRRHAGGEASQNWVHGFAKDASENVEKEAIVEE